MANWKDFMPHWSQQSGNVCPQNGNGPLYLVWHCVYLRNMPMSRSGFTPHELHFERETPNIIMTLKSFWLSTDRSNLNVSDFTSGVSEAFSFVANTLKSEQNTRHWKALCYLTNWTTDSGGGASRFWTSILLFDTYLEHKTSRRGCLFSVNWCGLTISFHCYHFILCKRPYDSIFWWEN